jgi:hypothetical protein
MAYRIDNLAQRCQFLTTFDHMEHARQTSGLFLAFFSSGEI